MSNNQETGIKVSITFLGTCCTLLADSRNTCFFAIKNSMFSYHAFSKPCTLPCLCRVCVLGSLGELYKRGAGVLDVQYETMHTLLSCGYDTYIRLWDLRSSYKKRLDTTPLASYALLYVTE